jgi:hypothetical protein
MRAITENFLRAKYGILNDLDVEVVAELLSAIAEESGHAS